MISKLCLLLFGYSQISALPKRTRNSHLLLPPFSPLPEEKKKKKNQCGTDLRHFPFLKSQLPCITQKNQSSSVCKQQMVNKISEPYSKQKPISNTCRYNSNKHFSLFSLCQSKQINLPNKLLSVSSCSDTFLSIVHHLQSQEKEG